MVAILNSAILNLAILDSAILVFPLKLTHTCQDWFPPFDTKNLHSFIHTELDDCNHLEFSQLGISHLAQENFTHSFWLNLMMVAILNSAILDSASALWNSDTLFSSLRFTQKHLPPLWLWLKLIHSDSNSFILTQLDDGSHLEFSQLGFSHLAQKTSLIHSDLTWWWQPSRILPTWIQPLSHLGVRHLVILSQIHSKSLSL